MSPTSPPKHMPSTCPGKYVSSTSPYKRTSSTSPRKQTFSTGPCKHMSSTSPRKKTCSLVPCKHTSSTSPCKHTSSTGPCRCTSSASPSQAHNLYNPCMCWKITRICHSTENQPPLNKCTLSPLFLSCQHLKTLLTFNPKSQGNKFLNSLKHIVFWLVLESSVPVQQLQCLPGQCYQYTFNDFWLLPPTKTPPCLWCALGTHLRGKIC